MATPLDTRIDLTTPENIAFEYKVAGPWARLMAYLVDMFIRVVIIFITLQLLSVVGAVLGADAFVAMALVLYFILEWFYGGLFETFWNGQTPGKRLLKLRVLDRDGLPLAGWQAILRNLLRYVDLMPPLFVLALPIPSGLIGLIAAASNRRFQRLGDMAAGTMVIVEESNFLYGMVRMDYPQVTALAADLPANFQVPQSMARALAEYVDRRRTLHPQRALEVAAHLARPLIKKLQLPANTNHDLLLCALYQRTFLNQQEDGRANIRQRWEQMAAAARNVGAEHTSQAGPAAGMGPPTGGSAPAWPAASNWRESS